MRVTETLFSVTLKYLCQAVTQMCLPVMFNRTAKLFTSSGQSPLAFDPLDNRNPALRINYQKVSLLKESQEVATKWGLGRSA